jgi:L-lactate dehydrogenase complex protein LldG
MKDNQQARENILRRIRGHVPATKTPLPQAGTTGIYKHEGIPAIDLFVRELEKVKGHCQQCADLQEAARYIKNLAEENNWQEAYCESQELIGALGQKRAFTQKLGLDTKAGIICCESVVARLGSVLVSSVNGRRKHSCPEHQVIVAGMGQLVHDMDEAMAGIKAKYQGNPPSALTLITGPSRTADIEKTLVMGAHGPKTLTVVIIEGKGEIQ